MRKGASKVFLTFGYPSLLSRLVCSNLASKRKGRFGHGLALVGLLLQLALSLGHVYASHERHDGFQNVASACLIEEAINCPASDHDDDCPICQAMAMVATGVLPAAPAVCIPAVSNERLLPQQKRFNFRRNSASNFDARGPPCGLQA